MILYYAGSNGNDSSVAKRYLYTRKSHANNIIDIKPGLLAEKRMY